MSRAYETVSLKGFTRVQIVDKKTGQIMGDSNYVQNVVTDGGKQFFIVGCIGNVGNSSIVTHLALATKTNAVAAADTTIAGETAGRKSATKSFVSAGTLRCTASWAGTDLGGTATIGSIAMFGTSSSGTLCAAATYTTSQWTSDQNVNATYDLRFS